MVGQTATYTGADNILMAFDTVSYNNPFFSVWKGKEILTQNSVNDYDRAKKMMESLLVALDQCNNTDIITIKFHPKVDKNGYITDKSPVISSMAVRVCSLDNNGSIIGSVNDKGELPNAVWHMLKRIEEGVTESKVQNTALLERVAALEAGEAIAGVSSPVDPWERIIAFFEKPAGAQIIQQVMPVIAGYLKPQNNMMVNGIGSAIERNSDAAGGHGGDIPAPIAQNSDVGHVEIKHLNDAQYDVIDEVIFRLSKHTDDPVTDLARLAEYADKNPDMFKMLISNLRS